MLRIEFTYTCCEIVPMWMPGELAVLFCAASQCWLWYWCYMASLGHNELTLSWNTPKFTQESGKLSCQASIHSMTSWCGSFSAILPAQCASNSDIWCCLWCLPERMLNKQPNYLDLRCCDAQMILPWCVFPVVRLSEAIQSHPKKTSENLDHV